MHHCHHHRQRSPTGRHHGRGKAPFREGAKPQNRGFSPPEPTPLCGRFKPPIGRSSFLTVQPAGCPGEGFRRPWQGAGAPLLTAGGPENPTFFEVVPTPGGGHDDTNFLGLRMMVLFEFVYVGVLCICCFYWKGFFDG